MAFDAQAAKQAGYSDEEIATYLAGESKFDYAGAVSAGYSPAEIIGHLTSKKPTERTWGEALTDIPVSMAKGVGAVAALPGQLYGLATGDMDNVSTRLGKSVQDYWGNLQSSGLKAREALRSQALSEAEKEGFLSEFATAIGQTITDPALLTTFIAEQVPQLIGPAGAAKVAKLLTSGAGAVAKYGTKEAAEQAAQATAVKAAVGTGAVSQGADVGADTYAAAFALAKQQGMSDEQAKDVALQKARVAAAEAAVISLAAQRIPGAQAIEKRLAGVPGKGRIGAAIGESAGEIAEEGGGAFAKNVGLQEIDPTQSLLKGVGTAAGMGAIGGGTMGALLGSKAEEAAPATPTAPTAPVTLPTGAAANIAPQDQERIAQIVQNLTQQGVDERTATQMAMQEVLPPVPPSPPEVAEPLAPSIAPPAAAAIPTKLEGWPEAGLQQTLDFQLAKPEGTQNKPLIAAIQAEIARRIPAQGAEDVGTPITPPSGAGPGVVSEPGTGAAPAGVGVVEPSGVVPSGPDVAVADVREGRPPVAVAPEPIAPIRTLETVTAELNAGMAEVNALEQQRKSLLTRAGKEPAVNSPASAKRDALGVQIEERKAALQPLITEETQLKQQAAAPVAPPPSEKQVPQSDLTGPAVGGAPVTEPITPPTTTEGVTPSGTETVEAVQAEAQGQEAPAPAQSEVATPAFFTNLGVAPNAALRKRVEGKPLADPQVRVELEKYAKNPRVPAQAKQQIAAYLTQPAPEIAPVAAPAAPTPPPPPAPPTAPGAAPELPPEQPKARTQQEKENAVDLAYQKLQTSKNAEEVAQQASLLYAIRNSQPIIPVLKAMYKSLDSQKVGLLLIGMTNDLVAGWANSVGITELDRTNRLLGQMRGLNQKLLMAAGDTSANMQRAFAKDPTLEKKLIDVVYASTLARIDPTVDRTVARLTKDYDALGPDGKRIYAEIKGHYETMINYYEALLDAQINSSRLPAEDKAKLIASIKKMYEVDKRIKPFFPLERHGDRWLSVGKGPTKQFYILETIAEREMLVERIAKERGITAKELLGDETQEVRTGDTLESFRSAATETSAMLKETFDLIDAMQASDIDAAAVSSLKDSIYDLYLTTLPEQSFRKNFITRKDITGFSTDLSRNFSTSAVHMSSQLSRIRYGQELRDSLTAARGQLGEDAAKNDRFIREMQRRVAMELNPFAGGSQGYSQKTKEIASKVAGAFTSLSYVYYLSSASSALVQMLGITYGATNLGARYGYAEAAGEMKKFAKVWNELAVKKENSDGSVTWVMPTVANSKSASLNADERRAIDSMITEGVSEVTVTSELMGRSRISSLESQTPTAKTGRALNTFFGGLFHTGERLSKEVVYLSSYRLNRKKGRTHEQAVAQAVKDTNDSFGNVAQWNRPPVLRGPIGKITSQFLMFPIFILGRTLTTFYQTLPLLNKAGKKQAFKEFAGIMGATWTLAGVAGLPLFSTIMGFVGAALKDADEEDMPEGLKQTDFELWFKKVFLEEQLGQTTIGGVKLSEIIERGPLNAITGLDIGGRTSLNNMILREGKETKSTKEGAIEFAKDHAGASVNMMLSFMDAYDAFADGDMQKGLEKVLPASFRAPVVAFKYYREGVKDARGVQLLEKDELSTGALLFQAIGLRTDELANLQQTNFKLYSLTQRAMFERGRLLNNLRKSYMKDDMEQFDKLLDERDKFNSRFPYKDLAIEDEDIDRSIKKAEEAIASSERGFGTTLESTSRFDEVVMPLLEQIEKPRK